jgi:hypothetical protein
MTPFKLKPKSCLPALKIRALRSQDFVKPKQRQTPDRTAKVLMEKAESCSAES